MATPYEQYLRGQSDNQETPYEQYLGQQNISSVESIGLTPYQQYLSSQPNQSEINRSVAVSGNELLEERESPGFMGALWSGLKSGATLGWASDMVTEPQSMTFGEEVANLTGELAGGLLPFIGVSAITGGSSAPIAGAKYSKKCLSSL